MTARRQLRAYLGIEDFKLSHFSLTEPIRVRVIWKNFGGTPAKRFETHGLVWIAPLPLDDETNFEQGGPDEDPVIGRHSRQTIYPGEHRNPRTTEYTSHATQVPMPKELMDEVVAGRFAIYVAGKALYRDVFGKKRETPFCQYIMKEDAATLINAELNNLPLDMEVRFTPAHILNDFT
jgi:hypothetical protein